MENIKLNVTGERWGIGFEINASKNAGR